MLRSPKALRQGGRAWGALNQWQAKFRACECGIVSLRIQLLFIASSACQRFGCKGVQQVQRELQSGVLAKHAQRGNVAAGTGTQSGGNRPRLCQARIPTKTAAQAAAQPGPAADARRHAASPENGQPLRRRTRRVPSRGSLHGREREEIAHKSARIVGERQSARRVVDAIDHGSTVELGLACVPKVELGQDLLALGCLPAARRRGSEASAGRVAVPALSTRIGARKGPAPPAASRLVRDAKMREVVRSPFQARARRAVGNSKMQKHARPVRGRVCLYPVQCLKAAAPRHVHDLARFQPPLPIGAGACRRNVWQAGGQAGAGVVADAREGPEPRHEGCHRRALRGFSRGVVSACGHRGHFSSAGALGGRRWESGSPFSQVRRLCQRPVVARCERVCCTPGHGSQAP